MKAILVPFFVLADNLRCMAQVCRVTLCKIAAVHKIGFAVRRAQFDGWQRKENVFCCTVIAVFVSSNHSILGRFLNFTGGRAWWLKTSTVRTPRLNSKCLQVLVLHGPFFPSTFWTLTCGTAFFALKR